MTHELIRAYDQCRAKVDWSNCAHHACSEVRAAALSGDCDFKQEFNKRQYGLANQGKVCVRRRAELSLQQSTNCSGEKVRRSQPGSAVPTHCRAAIKRADLFFNCGRVARQAKLAVDLVFDECYKDIAPFEHHTSY